MPSIFLGNFDFEHELARPVSAPGGPAGGILPATPAGDRSWCWLSLAAADDLIIAPAGVARSEFAALEARGCPIPRFVSDDAKLPRGADWQFIPWGWTESLRRLARDRGWEGPAPPDDVVRRVNSRAFRWELEQQLRVALPGSQLVHTLGELEAALLAVGHEPRGWLLKANFGMAGREAQRGRGTRLTGPVRGWAERRLQTTGPIVVEPLLERIDEAGIQLEIPQSGEPRLIGVAPQRVDAAGVYRGSRFACPPAELAHWQPAVDTALRVAHLVQETGYFGPLGIDAMLYRDAGGDLRLRPLQDLNARYTMGRLALEYRRLLPAGAGWCGTWLHLPARFLLQTSLAAWLETLPGRLPGEVLVLPASPGTVDPRGTCALLILAPSSDLRTTAEALVLNSSGPPQGPTG